MNDIIDPQRMDIKSGQHLSIEYIQKLVKLAADINVTSVTSSTFKITPQHNKYLFICYTDTQFLHNKNR